MCPIYKHFGIYIDGKGAKNGKYNAIEWKYTNNINNIPWTIYNENATSLRCTKCTSILIKNK